MRKYSLHEPKMGSDEALYVQKCINTGWLSPSGNFVKNFKKSLNDFTNSDIVLTNSGTSALHLSLILANVKMNDEVIVPTITFVATINAVLYKGASPIFMDCKKNNPNIDIENVINFLKQNTFIKKKNCINKKSNKRISAIILTHVFGNVLEFSKLKSLCKLKNIKIIEDAAEALGSKFENGFAAGIKGDYGILSFNVNKIITSSGGGALFVKNKKDKVLAEQIIKQNKTNDVLFHHSGVGYNYGMSNISAAIGLAQLKKINSILLLKKKINQEYQRIFKFNEYIDLIDTGKFSNFWLNAIIIKKNISYLKLKNILKEIEDRGVQVRPLWYPCHKQVYLRKYEKFNLLNSNILYKKIICLPSSFFLKKRDIVKISKIVIDVVEKKIT